MKLPPLSCRCHACGRVVIVQAPAPEEGDEQPLFVHELPWCERFDRVQTLAEAADFLRELRLHNAPHDLS